LIGTDGSNGLSGGEGNDELRGFGSGTMEEGADLLTGGGGDDVIEGGDGFDFANYDAACQPVEVDLAAGTATGQGSDTLVDVEGAFGSECDDTFVGNDADNGFVALEGDDSIDGADGMDTAIFLLAPGPVTADLSAGTAVGPVGNDLLANLENLWGSSDDDTLTGDDETNSILGWFGDDSLLGGAGDDFLDGGEGTDEADGQDGSDTCSAEAQVSCESSRRTGRALFPWSAPLP